MTLHVVRLGGCSPRPLSSYLKGLGVFRIVAEQADPGARASWHDGVLHLVSRLDEPALLHFFLHDWRPSAFVSPWNKGSGFFDATDKGLSPLEGSTAPRFSGIREGIAAARALTAAMDEAVQAERAINEEPKGLPAAERDALRDDPTYKRRLAAARKRAKQLKDALQPECQKLWRGDALRWLRAAVVLDADGGASFPGLLGTGGNDGKLDFTNNAMQRLGDLFDLGDPAGAPREHAAARLRAALLGDLTSALVKGAIGQFSPAASGGANASSGPLADSRLNPWDLPLLLEGSVLFTASSNRRLLGKDQPRVAAPFTLNNKAVGAGSEVALEESPRGEQWMPLWDRPWALSELETVLTEGRAQLGARAGKDPLDMARAVARLGVARGITAFERYGYLQRNGKSNYAVPLGRWPVEANPHAALLDDLEQADWWPRLQRAARSSTAPASLRDLERRLADLAVAALHHGGESARWRAVATTLARIEAALVRSESFTAGARLGPLPPLGPRWVDVVGDDTTSRLALALAGAGGPQDHAGVRAHWLPELSGPMRFATTASGLRTTTRMVVQGREAATDLIAVVQRRLVEAEAGAARVLPLPGTPGTHAALDDLAAVVDGTVDLEEVLWLARFFAALRPGGRAPRSPRHARRERTPDLAWVTVRLVHLAGALDANTRVPVDPAVVRLLSAGEAGRATEIARRRLGAVGIRPPFTALALDPAAARRIAASLAFPISPDTARELARQLQPISDPTAQEAQHVR